MFAVEDASTIYSVASMGGGNLAVSLAVGPKHEGVVRVYDPSGETTLAAIDKDEDGKCYFMKPQYMVTTGKCFYCLYTHLILQQYFTHYTSYITSES